MTSNSGVAYPSPFVLAKWSCKNKLMEELLALKAHLTYLRYEIVFRAKGLTGQTFANIVTHLRPSAI